MGRDSLEAYGDQNSKVNQDAVMRRRAHTKENRESGYLTKLKMEVEPTEEEEGVEEGCRSYADEGNTYTTFQRNI